MSFQYIRKAETADFYIDLAFRRAKAKAAIVREKKAKAARLSKSRHEPRIKMFIAVERERLITTVKILAGELELVLESFPSIDSLPKFYLELVKCTLDYEQLKKSLGALNWAVKRLRLFLKAYLEKLRKLRQFESLQKLKREFFGRVSSVMKQINENLKFLEASRRVIRNFPSVDANLTTVVIAGYPNVGKTTLLKALTGSEPKIASYPFTTQKLMFAYLSIKGKKLQLIDTPGLLDRPLSKRNRIEMQAVLALRHLANFIIFVVDASESCGYSLKEQINLFHEVSSSFEIPGIVAINKIDIRKPEMPEEMKAINISAEKNIGIDKLINIISTL